MAQATWEKPVGAVAAPAVKSNNRTKFAIVGGLLMFGLAVLILFGTLNNGRYFITVKDMQSRSDLVGKTIKVSGAVVGSTIRFDADTKTIHFTIANVTDDANQIEAGGGLAAVLHTAVLDTNAPRVDVIVENQAMPDLLKNEAQAIVTGRLDANGVFHADELLLKCPSKYSADLPQQASAQ
jgi:cytochrome c-type biogenesis protein CcmE